MIYFLLPAYNEESALPLVLETISGLNFPGENWHVVAVDDGSSDGTPDILKKWAEKIPMTVLTHSPNMGLGRAMRTGLTHLTEIVKLDDAVVALDADNTQDPKLSLKMREKQLAKDLDIVIASRYHRDEHESGKEVGLAFHRKVLSRGVGIILDMAFRVKGAKDYSCGFRLYSGRILLRAKGIYGDRLVEEANFVCMAEILVKLDHIGAKIDEVSMVLRYDLKGSASKMKVIRTILRYFRMIWRYKVLGELRQYKYAR
ncbi:MAG: glycosyltransferase family 2 protein [bacterium]|nr:glycosyltransferase family 2 protein [bacterium]